VQNEVCRRSLETIPKSETSSSLDTNTLRFPLSYFADPSKLPRPCHFLHCISALGCQPSPERWVSYLELFVSRLHGRDRTLKPRHYCNYMISHQTLGSVIPRFGRVRPFNHMPERNCERNGWRTANWSTILI
jgi:hypothetical protein